MAFFLTFYIFGLSFTCQSVAWGDWGGGGGLPLKFVHVLCCSINPACVCFCFPTLCVFGSNIHSQQTCLGVTADDGQTSLDNAPLPARFANVSRQSIIFDFRSPADYSPAPVDPHRQTNRLLLTLEATTLQSPPPPPPQPPPKITD